MCRLLLFSSDKGNLWVQRHRCRVLEVVVVLGVDVVHGALRVTGCEEAQLNDVFDQAGVFGRPVVPGEDVFGSHADTPVALQ